MTVRGRRKREGRKVIPVAAGRRPPPQSVYNCLVWLRKEEEEAGGEAGRKCALSLTSQQGGEPNRTCKTFWALPE